ncbi:ankyrin-2-like [Trichogramma pretiosum]|uniref:ankyrin-2-like n=1 Tax=Trichogramma pretiosum TaxID=7493 RepID=UPI0006C97FC0|nr:ankyrin-2-like [Trichogramma pretiosum]
MPVNTTTRPGHCTEQGHHEVAELLLRNGANPNLADGHGETALHFICQHDVDFAEEFFKITDEINRPVEINAMDKAGVTPLHWAVYHKHKKLANLLLRRGANPDLAHMDGQTALQQVANLADKIIAYLKSVGFATPKCKQLEVIASTLASEKEHFCDFVLLTIIEWEDWCCWDQFLIRRFLFRSLLRKGAKLNWTDVDGWTHMHFLCKLLKDDDKVDEFFEKTYGNNQLAKINAVDRSGWTPLHWAVFLNDKIFAKLLLRKGANPNVADKNGRTPLHLICMRLDDDDDFVRKFIDIPARTDQWVRIDAPDGKGWTPMRWAMSRKHLRVATVLWRRGERRRRPKHLRKNYEKKWWHLERYFDDDSMLRIITSSRCDQYKCTTDFLRGDRYGNVQALRYVVFADRA